ncbi:hypothetical protein HYFRA_00009264 [Hymenoscyphus fraxineus]|uniref:Bacteriophage T5 Orf172 DNA-binding domain-containing protein n=1 Tax=Hymenoscyphus fraxineus TaxID=746836 RepID=A0A9N9L2J4_9HELO|nr:hypothetical protein HYFRA_00009264 [Hymenoscyphus fraxineus]
MPLSPSYKSPTERKTPEKLRKPVVIDLVTDSESDAANSFSAREYVSPKRPTPRTRSTNSSAVSSVSRNPPEIFDDFAQHTVVATPSPDSSVGDDDDVFQSNFITRVIWRENGYAVTKERHGQDENCSASNQPTKEARPSTTSSSNKKKSIRSPRSQLGIVPRSEGLISQKDSSQLAAQQSPRAILPSVRNAQVSSGSPLPRRSARRSLNTKSTILEERCERQFGDNSSQTPAVVQHVGNPSPMQESGPTAIPDLSVYPRFADYKKSRKQHITNAKIIERLLEGSSPQSFARKTGWIYVLESPSHAKGYVKIGKTVGSCSTREKAWGNCNFPIQQVEDINMKAFDHCSLVESLIMLELYNQRKKFECQSCKGKKGTAITHTEWFEIDKQTALRHVQMWRNWIAEYQPFSEDGKLTGYWSWRLGKLSRHGVEVDWSSWTDPFWHGKYVYQISRHLERKDMQYWIVGFVLLGILDKYKGSWSASFFFIALLAL